MVFEREDFVFLSGGTECAGWLYLPEGVVNPPVVVMAHGFGAERTFRLPAFAERFAEDGLAVFLFDYRNFGDSEGEPRNLIDPFRHVEDWKAAVDHVRSLDVVDASRVGLWGTSFSGGHVIETAGVDRNISAVVSQVPFVGFTGGLSTLVGLVRRKGFSNVVSYGIQAVFSAFWDMLKQHTVGEPYCVPIVGDPDSFAMLNTPDSKPGYMSIVPEDSSWENKAPARIFLKLPFYSPISSAPNVDCPTLLLKAEKDTLVPSASVEKASKIIGNSEIIRLDAGHFDVYTGDLFERVVEKEVEFLTKQLIES